MAISTPRRFKSRHGTYGVRFLVPKHAQAAVGKKEIRISLGTRDPELARQLALKLCLEFEKGRMATRKQRSDEFLTIHYGFEMPNGSKVEVHDQADHDRFLSLLDRRPDIAQALTAAAPAVAKAEGQFENYAPVAKPTELKDLIEDHLRSLQGTAELDSKTIYEKRRAFRALLEHLQAEHDLTADAHAHVVTKDMLVKFVEAYSHRKAKGDPEGRVSADTLAKVCGHITGLFDHARERDAVNRDLTDGLRTVVKARQKASAGKPSKTYIALSNNELSKIFEPRTYLARMNQPDYFWVPLLGLALGTRLSEIVTLKPADVMRDPDSSVWVLDLKDTKNAQSDRRVPLPQQILDAGLLDYRAKVVDLQAPLLFPFGDFEGPTWEMDPSKNVSRTFGKYLDHLEIVHAQKVFHSLRKNAISTLNALNVPSGDRRAIAGHASDDEEERLLSAGPRDDVHDRLYTQTALVSLHGESPMQRLKGHLDRAAAALPVDWSAFRLAADIVLETVRRVGPDSRRLRGGWHTNAAPTCAKKIALLQSRIEGQTP